MPKIAALDETGWATGRRSAGRPWGNLEAARGKRGSEM